MRKRYAADCGFIEPPHEVEPHRGLFRCSICPKQGLLKDVLEHVVRMQADLRKVR